MTPLPLHSRRPLFGMLAILICGMQSTGLASIQTFTGTSVDGHAVSGSVEWTVNAIADTITFKLTNTTAVTHDAGELFSGINFTLGGLVPSLVSDLGIRRTVASNGTFSDTAPGQDLSWSVVSLGVGLGYQLNFNPNAKDAIIGPPTGSVYTANSSIKGNSAHNPFAALTATFVVNATGLLDTTPIVINNFLYGTELHPATPSVPEPISFVVWGGLATVVGAVAYRRNRVA